MPEQTAAVERGVIIPVVAGPGVPVVTAGVLAVDSDSRVNVTGVTVLSETPTDIHYHQR